MTLEAVRRQVECLRSKDHTSLEYDTASICKTDMGSSMVTDNPPPSEPRAKNPPPIDDDRLASNRKPESRALHSLP